MKHLPVGKIENIIPRLQDWEIDEIAVLNITHSDNPVKDFDSIFNDRLLAQINTPLSYGGGIDTPEIAERVVNHGCERVILSSSNANSGLLSGISQILGEQSILLHCPVEVDICETEKIPKLAFLPEILDDISKGWGGEIFFKFRTLDGRQTEFDQLNDYISAIPAKFQNFLVGGGISQISKIEEILILPQISGVVIGNWLNNQELVVPRVKVKLKDNLVRKYSGESI